MVHLTDKGKAALDELLVGDIAAMQVQYGVDLVPVVLIVESCRGRQSSRGFICRYWSRQGVILWRSWSQIFRRSFGWEDPRQELVLDLQSN